MPPRATARCAGRPSRRHARHVRVTVRKDLHLTGPEFEAAPDPWADFRQAPVRDDGIGPELMEAARGALRRMIDWLGREHGLDPVQAYLLCSVAVDLGPARSWTSRTSSSPPTVPGYLRLAAGPQRVSRGG